MTDIDINRNIIYLTGDITEDTVSYFISRVNYLVEENKDREILVYLNSYGGDMYSAFGIIDYMNVCEVKIGIACYGAVMSAAALILINATGEKVMSKNSYLMFHPPWIDKDENINENHMKDLKKKIIEQLAINSKKTHEFWEKELNSDYYINARKSLEMGLIHRVLSY